MNKPSQTLSKKIFAGFAAILLIAMTALVPALMDVREILLALRAPGGQPAPAAINPASSPETADHVAALAAHAYSFGVIGTALLVAASLVVAYAVTRAVNLPLLAIWQRLSACAAELNAAAGALDKGGAVAGAESLRRVSTGVEDVSEELRSILGVGNCSPRTNGGQGTGSR